LTIGILTLGCPKNLCDSDIMRAKLIKGGYEICADAYSADCFIINTCGFIQSAKEEAIEEILAAAGRKAAGAHKKIIITGCLAARYKKEITEQFPEADAVAGLSADITDIVARLEKGETRLYREGGLNLDGERVVDKGAAYAYLRIADGCDNVCSYCAIPHFRGRYRSRSIAAVTAEARELAGAGVRELVLVAQDVTAYGKDIDTDLCALLRELVKTDVSWIRLMYCYPERVTDELIRLIKTEPKIVNYLDMPIQHCNDGILKKMNRLSSRVSLDALIKKLRAEIPGVALRTTFIAGFPGETEEIFTELAEFSYGTAFTHAGAFAYSEEEGTAAAEFDGQVDTGERVRRAGLIEEQQGLRRGEYFAGLRGTTVRVLAEYLKDGVCGGRGYMSAPEVDFYIFFEGEYKRGDFADVVITGDDGENLFGAAKP